MAEEILVKDLLDADMIAAGRDLLHRLDQAHYPVVAALWLYDTENNEWQLSFASPVVEDSGPLAA